MKGFVSRIWPASRSLETPSLIQNFATIASRQFSTILQYCKLRVSSNPRATSKYTFQPQPIISLHA